MSSWCSLRVGFDEGTSVDDVLAHQDLKQSIGGFRIRHGDLQRRALLRIIVVSQS